MELSSLLVYLDMVLLSLKVGVEMPAVAGQLTLVALDGDHLVDLAGDHLDQDLKLELVVLKDKASDGEVKLAHPGVAVVLLHVVHQTVEVPGVLLVVAAGENEPGAGDLMLLHHAVVVVLEAGERNEPGELFHVNLQDGVLVVLAHGVDLHQTVEVSLLANLDGVVVKLAGPEVLKVSELVVLKISTLP